MPPHDELAASYVVNLAHETRIRGRPALHKLLCCLQYLERGTILETWNPLKGIAMDIYHLAAAAQALRCPQWRVSRRYHQLRREGTISVPGIRPV